jgi:RNA polymerase sigma-70 factor, ECF subfamily
MATVLRLQRPFPFCHSERSRGICCAPFGCPKFTGLQLPPLCHPESLWLFRSFRIRRTLSDVLQPPAKTVILSVAPRRSVAYARVYGAKSKDLGDADWQLLFAAFHPQTSKEIKKAPNEADLSRLPRLAVGRAVDESAILPPLSYPINFNHPGSFTVEDAIQGRGHSLLWSRNGTRKKTSTDDADPEAQLVERLKQRDESAFLALYDRHRRSVYWFLVHMTGSVAVAEDLTQGVFVAILEKVGSGTIEQFDFGKGAFEGYLLGIARNLAREERRKTYRFASLESVFEAPEWQRVLDKFCRENQIQDAEALLAAQSDLKLLYRAILDLPHPYRETIVLCSLQEKSYQQAAAILQCSEGTVASRLHRAKGLLAAKMLGPAANEVKASAG